MHMHYHTITLIIWFVYQTLVIEIVSTNSEHRGKTLIKSSKYVQDLDYEGKISLGWTIDEEEQSITFEIEGETDGYIGLGISPHGIMAGSDIFIAGVLPNGSSYHSDSFVPKVETQKPNPQIDKISNWRLLTAEEVTITSATKRGHTEVTKTYLKVVRFLDTCDEAEDLKIGKDPTMFIWALGEKDEIDYHGVDERGSKTIDLYQVEGPQQTLDLAETLVFELKLKNVSIPLEDSDGGISWCTFYQAPDFSFLEINHVVALRVVLGDTNAQKFVGHMTLYSCTVGPEDSAYEIFYNFTIDKFNGTNCLRDIQEMAESEDEYDDDHETPRAPLEFCTEMLHSWSRGNMDLYFPANVGYAFGDQEGSRYYMLETRLSNPENFVGDIELDAKMNMHYVDELRPFDAGQIWISRNSGAVIPPNVYDYVVAAHCSPNCSGRFPRNGITIFNTILQAAGSATTITVRHFRRGTELPWIDFQKGFNSNFHKSKQLLRPVTVFPGDHIVLECTYDTIWKNGTVDVVNLSGLGTTCEGRFWYYPKMEVAICGSSYSLEDTLLDFGITKYDIITDNQTIQIEEPESLEGEFESVLNTKFNWTLVFRQLLETKTRFSLQDSLCYTRTQKLENVTLPKTPRISYPIFARNHPYIPEGPECTLEKMGSMPGGVQNVRGSLGIIIFTIFIGFMFQKCIIIVILNKQYQN